MGFALDKLDVTTSAGNKFRGDESRARELIRPQAPRMSTRLESLRLHGHPKFPA